MPEIMKKIPAWAETAEPDSYRDFLGVRTRVAYLPDAYRNFAGKVEGEPSTERAGICHDPLEWAGVLAAVSEAKDRFVCIELGAGWGPFVVGAAKAAQRRGIEEILLVAVEPVAERIEFLRQHFVDNGLDPNAHHIVQAVIARDHGTARFEKLEDARDGDGRAIYYGLPNWLSVPDYALENVQCVPLRTLMSNLAVVDVIHFDIQGAEWEIISRAIDLLNEKVRRLVIGTHRREIEQGACELRNLNSYFRTAWFRWDRDTLDLLPCRWRRCG
jgi:FkbM family methyltransferase